MGFDPVKVERTILERIRQTSEGYSIVEDLIQDITSGVLDSDSDAYQESEGKCSFLQVSVLADVRYRCSDRGVNLSLWLSAEDPLKKLEKLQREKLCKVCMDSDIAIVFIPCGHLVTCKKCSDSLNKCPICCADITQKIKTYCS